MRQSHPATVLREAIGRQPVPAKAVGYCTSCDRSGAPLSRPADRKKGVRPARPSEDALQCVDCAAMFAGGGKDRIGDGDYLLVEMRKAGLHTTVWTGKLFQIEPGGKQKVFGPAGQRFAASIFPGATTIKPLGLDGVKNILRRLIVTPPSDPFVAVSMSKRGSMRGILINPPDPDLHALSGAGNWGLLPPNSVINRAVVLHLLQAAPGMSREDWTDLMHCNEGRGEPDAARTALLQSLDGLIPKASSPDGIALLTCAPNVAPQLVPRAKANKSGATILRPKTSSATTAKASKEKPR